MTLIELNTIEKVLKENMVTKENERNLFREKMREKYCEDGDYGFRNKMDKTENKTYDRIISDSCEARKIYESFIQHSW